VRFVFIPGTIGSLTWLERNRETAARIVGGLTLTCLGDSAPLTYKRTFGGKAEFDHVASQVLTELVPDHEELDFYPYGYDERQYNSPGFRMPIGSLMRSRHGRFPEYHTSADNISLISERQLEEAANVVLEILKTMDQNRRFRSLAPEGEPQLGRRGIYRVIGGGGDPETRQYAMLWLLQAGDGSHTLLDVAERSSIAFRDINAAAIVLEQHALIEWC
jgi:aminopeptidase-like protein